MLNHTRRAPPPPQLIRLYSPTGLEREAQMDTDFISPQDTHEHLDDSFSLLDSLSLEVASTSSHNSSIDSRLISTSASGMSSSSTIDTTFGEEEEEEDTTLGKTGIEADRPAYFDLKMKWCKGPFHEQEYGLPTSVSINSFLASPTAITSPSEEDHCSRNTCWSSEVKSESKDTNSNTLDWLSKLAESSFHLEQGEVLFFLQSDRDPRRRSQVNC